MFVTVQSVWGWIVGKIKLSLVFEVVDDPTDDSEHLKHVKPVNIWICFVKDETTVLLRDDFHKAGNPCIFIPNITKQTARELRTWGTTDTSMKGYFLHVLAEPTEEWREIYGYRQYKLKVLIGQGYNIAVSLPRKDKISGSTVPPAKTIPKPPAFNL